MKAYVQSLALFKRSINLFIRGPKPMATHPPPKTGAHPGYVKLALANRNDNVAKREATASVIFNMNSAVRGSVFPLKRTMHGQKHQPGSS